MFWYLLFAHLIADYPLQWNRLLEAKGSWRGLLIHVSIVFGVMLVLVGLEPWLPLLLLALLHMIIDRAKSRLSRRWPKRIVSSYVIDQFVHLLTLVAFALLITPDKGTFDAPQWVIYAVGYLLATYVWAISERVIAHSDQSYSAELVRQFWPRMIMRAILLTGLVLVLPVSGMAVIPYISSSGRRALLTDVFVVLGARIVIEIGA
jgi:hypothetical protein